MHELEEAKRIFDRAVEMSGRERSEFLEKACQGRPALQDQVDRMIAAFESGNTRTTHANRFKIEPETTPLLDTKTGQFQGTARFKVQRQLGSGAFGTVYQVWDREQNVTLAAKVLHRWDPEVLLRFKREFRSAYVLHHDNLVRLNELFSEGEQWFFTMEFVDGESFLEHVRPAGEGYRPDRLRPALSQLAQGVQALHAAKCLHRDLKPSNVLVTAAGRVVLLDFGLIRDLQAGPADQSFTVAGTPAYMAPEQGTGMPVSEASDWYAVGVMVFQALTGKLPHPRSALEQWVRVLDERPPQPRDLNPETPDDLNALCRRMLEPRTENRPSEEEILAVLTGGAAAGHNLQPEEHGHSQPESGAGEFFVGRSEQLAALEKIFSETQEGQLRVVLIHGPSGIGKTSTVRHFLKLLAAKDPRLIVLRGRCYEFESVPYKGLDALVDELTHYLHRLPEARVEALLPRDAFLLPTLFPVLGRVKSIAKAPARSAVVPDAQELRQRTFAALRELIARLSDRQSVVVWIDDLQWGDRDSSTFLAELCAPPQQPPLLLLLTYRSEDLASNPTLRYLHTVLTTQKVLGNWRQITIPELNPEESRKFIGDLLVDQSRVAEEVRSHILKEAAGHPLFLQQLTYSAVSRPELSLGPESGHELELRSLLQRRAAELPAFAREVLEFASIAAQPLVPHVVLAAANAGQVDDRERAETIALLVSENLARISGTPEDRRIEPFHDQIRTAVVDLLTPEMRRARHARLAAVLSAQPQAEPQVLVTHYQEAGDLTAAHSAALHAAAAAEKQLAFDRAALFYQIALDANASEESKPGLYRKLADTLGKAGRGRDSAHAYLKSAEYGAGNRFDAQQLAADQLMRSGHIDEALELLDQLTQQTGIYMPHTPLRAILGIVLGRLQVRMRLLGGPPAPVRGAVPADRLARLEVLRTGGVIGNMADPVLATYFQVRHVLEAIRVREPTHLAYGLAIEASIRLASGTPDLSAALSLIERARQIAEDTGNANTLGFVYLCRSYLDYLIGNIAEGIPNSKKAGEFLRERCTGVAWELTASYVLLFWCLCWAGYTDEVRDLLPKLLKEGTARGDMNVEVSLRLLSYVHYSYLSADEPEECLRESRRALERWSKKGFHLQHYGAMFTIVETHLYLGDYPQARQRLLEDWKPMSKSFILRWRILWIMAQFLRGRVALACWLQDRGDRGLRAEVEDCAKRLERVRSLWGRPIASALLAGLAAGEGRREDAIRGLQAAYEGFEKISLHAYAASARHLCGLLRGGEQGRRMMEEASNFLTSRQVRNEPAFLRMLLPGDWTT